MDVYDFLELLNQDDVVVFIYDMTTETETRFDGKRDAQEEYGEYEVWSFDICKVCDEISVILNIETDE